MFWYFSIIQFNSIPTDCFDYLLMEICLFILLATMFERFVLLCFAMAVTNAAGKGFFFQAERFYLKYIFITWNVCFKMLRLKGCLARIPYPLYHSSKLYHCIV